MSINIAPIVIQPTFRWAGNDGNWSTFQVDIGTPPQSFDVLPSTCNGETWIPLPDSCPSTFADCASSRGVRSTTFPMNEGFQSDRSDTWSQTGIYGLFLEESLFGSNDTGLYGLDTLSVGDDDDWDLKEQTVAGIATPNFWLGSLGLSVQPSGFSVQDEANEPMLSSLKTMNMTPSASYGLSVGASYRQSAGGIVIGGYDADAFEPNEIQFKLRANGSRSLTVSLQSLVITNTVEGQQAMPITTPEGLNMSIDSTVSQIWLPSEICDRMQALLQLEYDSSRELYLVNSTTRQQLTTLSPTFTFTLAANGSMSNMTTTISLPYSAFDQEISEPYYNTSTAYFPVRRADDPMQFVLGRTFLQEAYVVADWDRGNFSLGQAIHQNGVSENVLPILQPVPEEGSSGLSTGAIAGTAVGAVVFVGLCCLAIWFFWWRRPNRRLKATESAAVQEHYMPEKDGYPAQSQQSVLELASFESGPLSDMKDRKPAEAMSGARYELHEDGVQHQLMSNAVYELPGHYAGTEMDVQRGRVENQREP